jgi:hypothetical protein
MHAEESSTLESHEGIKPATGVQWERNLVTTSRPGETTRRYVGQGKGGETREGDQIQRDGRRRQFHTADRLDQKGERTEDSAYRASFLENEIHEKVEAGAVGSSGGGGGGKQQTQGRGAFAADPRSIWAQDTRKG